MRAARRAGQLRQGECAVTVVTRSADFGTSALDRTLETTCGAFLSLSRLDLLERDARWESAYAVVEARGGVAAVLPLYLPRFAEWPDPTHDFANGARDGRRADEWAVVGGRAEYSAGLLRSTGLEPASALAAAEAAGAVVRDYARERERRLLAPFVPAGERAFLGRVFGPRAREAVRAREARMTIPPGPEEYLRTLRSSHRSVVRRDWRDRDRKVLTSEVLPWGDVLDVVPELIDDVASAHGTRDDPRLIRARLEAWLTVRDVEPVAFRTRSGASTLAICLGWTWRHMLQLYRVGLVPPGTPNRHLAYVESTVYAPLRYGASRGCTVMSMGVHATEPKRLRGASISELVGLEATR